MEKKIFTITDLGGGEGGKGSVVHGICCKKNVHTVMKVGGAQGGHGTETSRGEQYSFSQLGCGTFEGIATHISSLMVIEPFGLLIEAETLKYEFGIGNVFELLTISEDALCTTPFHMIKSQLSEFSRKGKAKGTVGMGIGTAIIDYEDFPQDTIRVKDILSGELRKKLSRIKDRTVEEMKSITENVNNLWKNDQAEAKKMIELLFDTELVDRIVRKFEEFNKKVKIVDEKFFKKILSRDGVIVVEGSHGILNDRYYGFHPHVTRLRTTPHNTIKLLNSFGYDGQIVNIGVCRAHQIRKGAGPLVTHDPNLLDKLLPGHHFSNNRLSGKIRVGALDTVMLRYAIEACGGSNFFDGLAVTCVDLIEKLGNWPVCESYAGTADSEFFQSENVIVSHDTGEEQSARQRKIGEYLNTCSANVCEYALTGNRNDVVELMCNKLEDVSGVPVKMMSFGPTENDKLYL